MIGVKVSKETVPSCLMVELLVLHLSPQSMLIQALFVGFFDRFFVQQVLLLVRTSVLFFLYNSHIPQSMFLGLSKPSLNICWMLPWINSLNSLSVTLLNINLRIAFACMQGIFSLICLLDLVIFFLVNLSLSHFLIYSDQASGLLVR